MDDLSKPIALSANIAEAGNTAHGFPVRILAKRGFTVITRPTRGDELEYWALRQDGVRMIGSSPLILLGLLAILDELGNDWNRNPKVDLHREFGDADVVDLYGPDAVRMLKQKEVVTAQAAFMLLCSFVDRRIDCEATQDSLMNAINAFLDADDEDERRANED